MLLIAVLYKLRIYQMLGIIVGLGTCMVKTTKACLQTDKKLQPSNLFLKKLEAQKKLMSL